MSGQFFKFAVRDLRPRKLESDQAFWAFWRTLLAIFPVAPINWFRIRSGAVLGFLLALALFATIFVGSLFFIDPEIAPVRLNSILDYFYWALRELAFPAAAIYLIAKLVQYALDWRDWHVPWANAHFDRVRANGHRAGAQDFPILLLGRGGSGKSTLAQILEHDFLRRQIFKPSGFQDEGGDERLVVRSPGGAVGAGARKYDVTWRPDMYKVGRLAEAYDMPGQITEDWEKAIAEIKNCRRVAIINAVTNGYNATIRKYKISHGGNFDIDPEHGVIYGAPEEWNADFSLHHPDNAAQLEAYRKYILQEEYDGFERVVHAIETEWKGRYKPKLLLIHVVNMADLWTRHTEDHWRELSREVLAHYDIKKVYEKYKPDTDSGDDDAPMPFYSLNKRLIDHLERVHKKCERILGSDARPLKNLDCVHDSKNCERSLGSQNVAIKVLPAAFHSGPRRHSDVEEFEIFDSDYEFETQEPKEETSNFDERMAKKVKKKEVLGRTSVKTIRAVRLALYKAYSGDWSDRSKVGEDYPLNADGKEKEAEEKDLYDVWREAEAER